MNDLISIALFVGCLLATFGFVRVCAWLRPVDYSHRAARTTSRDDFARHKSGGENGQ